MSDVMRQLKHLGLLKCTSFSSQVCSAWILVRGPEQFEAGIDHLASVVPQFERSPYRIHATIIDEFVHWLRQRYGRELSALELVSGVAMAEEIRQFEAELTKRIAGPERRRLLALDEKETLRADLEALQTRLRQLEARVEEKSSDGKDAPVRD